MVPANLKILLVEDDHDDAEMIMYSLNKITGIDIMHIDDSVKALDYLCNVDPGYLSLVLLDLKMPKVDGIEILRRMKTDVIRKNIPVAVMLSSHNGKQYVQSFGVNPDHYVLKPVDPSEFVRIITISGLSVHRSGDHADVRIIEK